MIDSFLLTGRRPAAEKWIKKLPKGEVRDTYLKKILAEFIEIGDLNSAIETAKKLNRNLSTKELRTIVSFCLKIRKDLDMGQYEKEREYINTSFQATGLLPEGKLKTSYLKKIANIYWEHSNIKLFRATVLLLTEDKNRTKYLEDLLRHYVKEGNLSDSEKVAENLNRKLTAEELDIIIRSCQIKGSPDTVLATIRLFPDKATRVEKLKQLIRNYITGDNLTGAERLAEVLNKIS